MTKLRRNHSVIDFGPFAKVGLLLLVAALFYWFGGFSYEGEGYSYEEGIEDEYATSEKGNNYYLPTSTTGQIIKHQYYTMSYSEEHEQPEWVAYEITRDQFQGKWVKRKDNFRSDPKVKSKSASKRDYRGSGYDRGHLVPAADMAFNEQAMSETFFMSNMSPQKRNFNGGIWRELEETTRDWAKKYKHLYVVTGPILTQQKLDKVGHNEVTVPSSYFKVLLDVTGPELKGIGFILENEVSDEPLATYATTIDEVESLTGIDFFPELLSEEKEANLEGKVEVDRWKFSRKRYLQRVKSWNVR